MIALWSVIVFTAALLLWMLLFEFRLARVLTQAEGTNDQADRALGFITDHAAWIADHAAPAVERIAALAPELADALVTHRSVLATLPGWMHRDFPEQPADQPRPRPLPGPRTEPDSLPANGGLKAARLTAPAQVEQGIAEAGREPNVDFAHNLALIEDQIHDWHTWQANLEETP